MPPVIGPPVVGLGDELLKHLDAWAAPPFEAAAPMPGWMYTSPDVARLELERVFHRGWVCVGRVDEIPNSGNRFTAVVGEQPVIVLRNSLGDVMAMSNVCAHRGMLLVDGPGNGSTFRCSYHSWVYDETGALRGAPYMEDSTMFDKSSICLPKYKVELWHGYIFVNLDSAAAPLAPMLVGLDPIYEALGVREMRTVMRDEVTYDCNWKVLAENFCESYHVGTVHSATLEPNTRTKTTRVRSGGDGFNLHTMMLRSAESKESDDLEVHDYNWLSCIYPSLAISVQSSSALSLMLRPDGAERVRCIAMVAVPYLDGDKDWRSQKDLDLVAEFMAEDEIRIEAVQRGLHGFNPTGGTYCHMEKTNWEFGQYLQRQLRA